MNEPQQPAIATSEHSGIGNEELSLRKDQLHLALSSAHNQGKPVRVTGVSWDVSERSQMENALARERFLLKTLMDSLPDHI
jgi:PAS domain-containing protein